MKCYDFVPKCIRANSIMHWPQFEQFSTILDPANKFLLQNPHLSVQSCETVRFQVEKDQLREPDNSAFIQLGEAPAPFVDALRLWLVPSLISPKEKGQSDQIGYVTFAPKLGKDATNSLADLTDGMNEYLQQNPLPGRLVSVESLQMQGVSDGQTDLDASCWKPKISLGTLQQGILTYFRIWYIKGEAQGETIGLADFFPAILKRGQILPQVAPQVASLPQVMATVNNWISQLPGNVKVLNIKTLSTRANMISGECKAYQTFCWDKPFHVYYLKFIRLVYVICPQACTPPVYEAGLLHFKLFAPGIVCGPSFLKEATFESQTVIKERLDEWIRQSAAKVVSVETIIYKTSTGGEGQEGYDAMHTWNDGNNVSSLVGDGHSGQPIHLQYLRCYRVYLEGDVCEPPHFDWPKYSHISQYKEDHGGICTIS